MHGETMKYLK